MMQSAFELIPRAIGLHGVSIPCPPWCKPAVSVAPPPPRRVLHHSAAKQIECLLAISEAGTVDYHDIAERLATTTDRASELLFKLNFKRMICDEGGRPRRYRLTAEGRNEATAWRQG